MSRRHAQRSSPDRRIGRKQTAAPVATASAPAASSSLLARLAAPVDGASSLAVFRICFGLAMLWHVLQYLLGGRLERQYLRPIFFFKFPGFAWAEPASPGLLQALFTGLALAALLIALGLFYRWACAFFCLGITYVFLLDAADYQNHTYLICLLSFLLFLVPAHRSLSLDVWRRPALRSALVPTWALWLLRFQVAVPYVYGGLAKLNADWLVRAQPMRLWLAQGTEGVWSRVLPADTGGYLLCWGGTLYDLLVIPALLWRRTRLAAFAITVAFHLTNAHVFVIGIFPWLMIAAGLLFFPPDWPRRIHLLRPLRVVAGAAAPAVRLPALRPVLAALLGLYLVLQLLLPFRHVLYAGNVDWTEEGHRFSWRMKLRDKRGTLRFLAVDRATGRVYPLEGLEAALTSHQRRMMEHDPEMIRQFAHFLAGQLARAGYPGVAVRAETAISLNGRPRQPLVDPTVDLAAQPASPLRHASWIVPLQTGAARAPAHPG
jgi:vitamin K-dependent gamma-carboxylase